MVTSKPLLAGATLKLVPPETQCDAEELWCRQAVTGDEARRTEGTGALPINNFVHWFKAISSNNTTSMHFVNSLRSYLSSKVENRLLGMNEKNYSLRDTFRVALECELKAIASER